MSRSQRNKKSKRKSNSFLDIYRSVRKPPIPATKAINPKKKYDRKDKSWMDED